jgi:hypothetical protein
MENIISSSAAKPVCQVREGREPLTNPGMVSMAPSVEYSLRGAEASAVTRWVRERFKSWIPGREGEWVCPLPIIRPGVESPINRGALKLSAVRSHAAFAACVIFDKYVLGKQISNSCASYEIIYIHEYLGEIYLP